MRRAMTMLIGVLVGAGVLRAEPEVVERVGPSLGPWSAWLESPGGRLAFGLELSRGDAGDLVATIINAEELIEAPTVTLEDSELTIGFDHYDSRIVATLDVFGKRLEGRWTKTGRDGEIMGMPFRAVAGNGLRRASGAHRDVRYSVRFAESGPAIADFRTFQNGVVHGTFRTPTGDYRYLGGHVDAHDRLTLSCFDGAHAFLFKAQAVSGTGYDMRGDFWSRDAWHETWRATINPDATLPDALTQTEIVDATPDLAALEYASLDGGRVTLASLKRDDRPMIIEVFGTWCPNCHDAAKHLAELQREYEKAGLVVVGLAFEMTDDLERSRRQVRTFRDRYEIPYAMLIAGKADKATAAELIPIIDRVRSYPTAIFIDAEGKVRAVYTGYSGPATGDAHDETRATFNRIVREMLDEVIK